MSRTTHNGEHICSGGKSIPIIMVEGNAYRCHICGKVIGVSQGFGWDFENGCEISLGPSPFAGRVVVTPPEKNAGE